MKTPPNYEDMIPRLATFLDGKPAGIEMFLSNIGRYDHLAAHASLIWPAFIEHEKCVFRGTAIPSSYSQWKEKFGDNTQTIEGMLNHLHIHDLFFDGTEPEPNHALVAYIGNLLRETWATKLALDFPDRVFDVHFPERFDNAIDNPSITASPSGVSFDSLIAFA